MNLGGHIAVAAKLGSDPDVWLGSALPDVGAMGRFNLLGDDPTGAIAEGIALHHATDDLFHGHPWFKEHQATLFEALTAAGIKRGGAKAVAHVGPELLLDGQILTEARIKRDIEAGMGRLKANLDAVELLVRYEKRPAWRNHLEKVSARRSPNFYDDPHAVAKTLERILRSRPRLALDPKQVEIIGELLTEVHPAIQATSVALIDDLAETLG